MMVLARRTSPPSRRTSCFSGSMRVISRVTRISAPSLRACCSARLDELFAGDAGGEAEVVLDARGGAGLAARRLALDDDGPQALRGPVDGGRQAGRAGADDDGVVLGGGGLGAQPQKLRDAAQLGLDHRLAAVEADDGAVAVLRQRAAPQLGRIRRVGGDPPIRDLVALEEVAELGALGVRAPAEHDGARRVRLGGDALQAARPAHALRREPADLARRRPAPPPRPCGSRAAPAA